MFLLNNNLIFLGRNALLKTCPICNTLNQDNSKFCMQCGNRLENLMGTITKKCPICGNLNKDKSNFCAECGYQLEGIRGVLTGWKKRIEYQSKNKIEIIKQNTSNKIAKWLDIIDSGKDLQIGSITVPKSKRNSVRSALESFKAKLSSENEFQYWLANLSDLLEDSKCMICFKTYSDGDEILMCKYCHSSAHKLHFQQWISQNNICPLCRHTLNENDLGYVKYK